MTTVDLQVSQAKKRTIKNIIISLIAGTLILVSASLYFEVDLPLIQKWAALSARDFVRKGFFSNENLAVFLGKATLYGFVGIIAASAYVLPLRVTDVIHKALTFWDRVLVFLSVIYLPAAVFGIVYLIRDARYKSMIDWYLNLFSEVHGIDRINLLWPPIIVLVGAVLFVGITDYALTCIRGLFLTNMYVNGTLPGVFISVYDIFLSLVIVGFAILTMIYVIAILGIFIMAAIFSGGGRVVKIDGKYYVVDE